MRGKGARRAALRLNETIAGLLAEQHHRAAGTTDGRRMIGEDYRRTGIVRGIDQKLGDRRRSRMEMHDARAYLAQDGPEAFGSDLIRNAISEFEYGGSDRMRSGTPPGHQSHIRSAAIPGAATADGYPRDARHCANPRTYTSVPPQASGKNV